jgi:hypothetical protein
MYDFMEDGARYIYNQYIIYLHMKNMSKLEILNVILDKYFYCVFIDNAECKYLGEVIGSLQQWSNKPKFGDK